MMPIEQGQEILISDRVSEEFGNGSREFRRQYLLDTCAFLCHRSECSLGGEDLEENERIRVKLREKKDKMEQLMASSEGPEMRKRHEKVMKLAQQRVFMIRKLNLRAGFVGEMILFYQLALLARLVDIRTSSDPDTFKQEAWKYAEMFGDNYIHLYNKSFNCPRSIQV